MDMANYDQFELRGETADTHQWLTETRSHCCFIQSVVVGIELPQFVVFEVDSVEPGSRGDTASGAVTTTAHTTTGIHVKSPVCEGG